MKNEYIIINKTAIQQRIEELEKERDKAALAKNEYAVGNFTGQIYALYELISDSSQSTPLTPEIEKAFDAGSDYGEDCANSSMGVGEDYPNKQNYISNLKLDI